MEGEQNNHNPFSEREQMPMAMLQIQLMKKALLALYQQTVQKAELMEKLGMDSTNQRQEQQQITEMYSLWK